MFFMSNINLIKPNQKWDRENNNISSALVAELGPLKLTEISDRLKRVTCMISKSNEFGLNLWAQEDYCTSLLHSHDTWHRKLHKLSGYVLSGVVTNMSATLAIIKHVCMAAVISSTYKAQVKTMIKGLSNSSTISKKHPKSILTFLFLAFSLCNQSSFNLI